MQIGQIGRVGRVGLAPATGVGAPSYAPSPAPSGFHWDFVTSGGTRMTSGGQPVVALVRN